ncbi:DUF6804 family protein [Candidatus Kaistella beijingensis]|uniref:DUF6804 family protein n=1 Tax=Candidatus Kaistella beijingensis TaxID=2820270 RepID=UPI003741EDB6
MGIFSLPYGFYTFLRLAVSTSSIIFIFKNQKNGIDFWNIIFGIMLLLFNPLFPVYLHQKTAWIIIDFIAGTVFLAKATLTK